MSAWPKDDQPPTKRNLAVAMVKVLRRRAKRMKANGKGRNETAWGKLCETWGYLSTRGQATIADTAAKVAAMEEEGRGKDTYHVNLPVMLELGGDGR